MFSKEFYFLYVAYQAIKTIVINSINKSIAVAWRKDAIIIKAGGIHAKRNVIVACLSHDLPVDNTNMSAITDEDNKYIRTSISKTGTAVSVRGATFPAKTKRVIRNSTIRLMRIYTCFLIETI